MKALIVDDESTVRLLLSRILRREVACAVTEATNGVEALDLLGREHFDFVVIDVMMPIMDGIETLEAIRSTPALQHLPVMVLSAVRDEVQVRRLLALGISAYLTKPVRPSDASARVKQFVTSLATTATAAHPAPGRSLRNLAAGARILVVDGEPDFLHVVTSALGEQYQVVEAESGVQGLRACLDARPAAILIGQNLGAVGAPLLLRKVRSLPNLANVPVVALVSRGTEPEADTDFVMPRSFVAESFRSQFARLVAGDASRARQPLTRDHLQPHVVAAVEQVFGMMLHVEVQADTAVPEPPEAGAVLGRVTLTLPEGDADLELGVWSGRGIAEQMTAIRVPDADVVAEEDVFATLREIATIVGGRIQSALHSRGEDVSIGAPSVSSLEQPVVMADDWTTVGFHDLAGQVRFGAFLRPVPHAADAVPAPVGAVRAQPGMQP